MDEALMTSEDAERVRELVYEKALDLGMTDGQANKLDKTVVEALRIERFSFRL